MTSFFESGVLSEGKVEWSVDGQPFKHFQPKLSKPRGKNPLYTSAQLVTPARWQDMQRSADNAAYPDGELLELYRIRGKAGWRELCTAAMEASIISESLLRAYGLKALKESGFSNSKLKRLRDELTFNKSAQYRSPTFFDQNRTQEGAECHRLGYRRLAWHSQRSCAWKHLSKGH